MGTLVLLGVLCLAIRIGPPDADRIGAMRFDGSVIVGGIPGSGKTTLARNLAPELALPLISKDTIKEALFDVLGTGDLSWSQSLGRASHRIMYALAS